MKKFLVCVMLVLFLCSASISATYWVTIPASAFKSIEDDMAFRIDWSSVTNKIRSTDISGTLFLCAPIHVPNFHGKKFKRIEALITDSTSTASIAVYLRRVDKRDGHSDMPFYVSTSYADTPGETTIADGTAPSGGRYIDNVNYGWFVGIQISGSADMDDILLHAVSLKIED
jgi:hypothetical protein